MTSFDNYRTHYCPDSGFTLISENDAEFEACNCFHTAANQTSMAGLETSEATALRTTPLLAEQIWYRTIAALAKVCGTTKPVTTETVREREQAEVHENEEALVKIRKS